MEGSNEQAAAELDGDGGAEGRNGQLHFLATHLSLSPPLSCLLGGGRDPATNHCNGLYTLPWGLPVCQELPGTNAAENKCQKGTGSGGSGVEGPGRGRKDALSLALAGYLSQF